MSRHLPRITEIGCAVSIDARLIIYLCFACEDRRLRDRLRRHLPVDAAPSFQRAARMPGLKRSRSERWSAEA